MLSKLDHCACIPATRNVRGDILVTTHATPSHATPRCDILRPLQNRWSET